jgi:hypothetical protein
VGELVSLTVPPSDKGGVHLPHLCIRGDEQ